MNTTTTQSDQELFERLTKDDHAAFRALYDRYYKYLVVTSNNILGDANSARDLAQDVYFDLWKKRCEIQIQSSLKAYLRQAVVNKTLNYIKARRLDFTEPERLPEPLQSKSGIHDEVAATELEQIIQRAIEALPERCRIIFTLCRLEQLPHKEIAEQLGITPKTVENQMTRALAFLREALAPYVGAWLLFGWLWNFL